MRIALLSGIMLLAVVSGCANKSNKPSAAAPSNTAPVTASMGIINTKCPVVPSHGAKPKTVVDFNGQKVGLCCAGCLPDWNKMSDEQKAAALKAAM